MSKDVRNLQHTHIPLPMRDCHCHVMSCETSNSRHNAHGSLWLLGVRVNIDRIQGSHLRQHLVQPLQRPIETHLDPTRC